MATTTTTTVSATSSTSNLSACLSAVNIRNFTAPFKASNFNTLLSLSIQNLRFSHPDLPKPAAVILPSSLIELQHTILCCRNSSLAIRLRSNGHSYEGLSYLASNLPFAVVDLMNLNRVTINLETSTAWVESGATLGEVYHEVATASRGTLGFSAGSCPTVGSGGHIAGGGFGLMSRKHGLAADNVVDAVIVDEFGRVLDRESMGEDVFWAVRGGGGGAWGAVYAWQLRLVPVPSRVTCFIINRSGSVQSVAALVDRWQRVGPGLPDEFYVSSFVGAGLPDATGPGLSTTFKGFYLGPKSEAQRILDPAFPELRLNGSDWHEMSWIQSILFFSGLLPGSHVDDLKDRVLHAKTYFKAKSDYVRRHIPVYGLIDVFALLVTEPKAYLILDPYGGAMERINSDYIAFPHRKGNIFAIQHLIEWSEGDDWKSKEYVEWLREFYDHVGPFVSKGPRAAYVNYLDLDLGTDGLMDTNEQYQYVDAVAKARVWGERYFLGNYDRLVQAKTKIDPNNVFSNDQSIPPLKTRSVLISGVSEGLSDESVV